MLRWVPSPQKNNAFFFYTDFVATTPVPTTTIKTTTVKATPEQKPPEKTTTKAPEVETEATGKSQPYLLQKKINYKVMFDFHDV